MSKKINYKISEHDQFSIVLKNRTQVIPERFLLIE